MAFNSLEFVVFLPIVFAVYWLLPAHSRRWRNGWLLLASYFFYGWWDWRFLGLIVASTLVDYVAALAIAASSTRSKVNVDGSDAGGADAGTPTVLAEAEPAAERLPSTRRPTQLAPENAAPVDIHVTQMDLDETRLPARAAWRPRLFLLASMLFNLGVLAAFKYSGWFVESLNEAVTLLGGELSLTSLRFVLPVGLSFYTFQTMSYTIDVYRGETAARAKSA